MGLAFSSPKEPAPCANPVQTPPCLVEYYEQELETAREDLTIGSVAISSATDQLDDAWGVENEQASPTPKKRSSVTTRTV